MRPSAYELFSPITMQRVEQHYEGEYRSLKSGGFFESATRSLITRPAIGSRATMVGNLSYRTIMQSMPRQTTTAAAGFVDPRVSFSRLVLQRFKEDPLVPKPFHRIPISLEAYHAPPPTFQECPKEVWDGSTEERLCTNTRPTSSDTVANQCFQSMRRVDTFFQTAYSTVAVEEPIHGNLMRVDIHDPEAFNNAFWQPSDIRVHCGDVDSSVFGQPLAGNPEVIVHEFGHAVTYYSSNLDYMRQSGAINESLSDVFAITEKQHQAGVRAGAADASWNIGEHLIAGAAAGDSLRSMSHPGTGFRGHSIIGDDDQVGLMSEYHGDQEPVDRAHDYGGVHKYSGIGNHAFYLAAIRDGGPSWERMGKIWHLALKMSQHDASFFDFARETIKASKDLGFGEPIAHIVAKAWSDVGVLSCLSGGVALEVPQQESEGWCW